MYKIPKDLDLHPIIGKFFSDILVGTDDIQFPFGDVCKISVESRVDLEFKNKCITAWPDENG